MKPARFFGLFRFLLPAALALTAAAQSNYQTPYFFSTFAGTSGGPGFADGIGNAARFRDPRGVAADGSGTIYVADALNHTIRKIASNGMVTTLAGTVEEQGGADGTGSAARFNTPGGIAADNLGNVYVADTENHTIRKITPAGVVTTFAGLAGSYGAADGTGSAARFSGPSGVALDPSGNLLVADTGNHTIRKITSAGVVTTFAGTAGTHGNADGTGTNALFYFPEGVSVDGAGMVYVADSASHTIRKITPAGVVTTLAGSTAGPYWGTGSADGTGANARFYDPRRVAADNAGNVFVADTTNHTIRKITAAGVVTTLAGTAGLYGNADGTGSAARFYFPQDVMVDSSGNVFVADNNSIRKITPAGVVSTLAGAAAQAGNADGSANAARFDTPNDVAVDPNGNVYVADTFNHTIRKITAAGVVTTLAGLPGTSGTTNGTGSAARFTYPRGLAVDNTGNVYVAEPIGDTVRKITPAGQVTTLAGGGGFGSADGTGTNAQFYDPHGLEVDGLGNVYVADTNNCTIRKITPAGVVTTLAGTAGVSGSADGTGAAARFAFPSDVAVDNAGNVYVTDSYNKTVRKITSSGVVTTLAGAPGVGGDADGTGSNARFGQPQGVAVDSTGNVFVADGGKIRKITATGVVTTVAGKNGPAGNIDGTGSKARFATPIGLTIDSIGKLYVADADTHNIRKGQLAGAPVIGTQPLSQTVATGGSVQFSVAAGGVPEPTYQWMFNGSAFSGATSNTLSFTNARSADVGDYTVVVTNPLGSVTSNKATLTVSAGGVPTPTPTPGSSGGGSVSAWFALALAVLAATRGHRRSRRVSF